MAVASGSEVLSNSGEARIGTDEHEVLLKAQTSKEMTSDPAATATVVSWLNSGEENKQSYFNVL